jgi:hypothetical protein
MRGWTGLLEHGEIGYEGMDWIQLAQDKVQWQLL